MRLISSEIALLETLALGAAGELPLARLAEAVEARPSAAQRALAVLSEDGIVERATHVPTYRLAENELAAQVFSLALLAVPLERAARIGGRANPALELLAVDGGVLVVVYASRHPASLVARGAVFAEELARRHGLTTRDLDHRDVRRELLPRPELREEMGRARILHGELDRSFPDRRRHGAGRGRPLGRPHPTLRPPSRRLLGRLARQHGLRSLHLFGSSVRSDFRPDSDVDVLVGFQPHVRPTVRGLVELGDQLEAALDRDIDLVREESLEPAMRDRVLAEAVPLL
jgi:uncharacterized protein